MARSSECTGSYAHKVLDRDPHCQRRLISTVTLPEAGMRVYKRPLDTRDAVQWLASASHRGSRISECCNGEWRRYDWKREQPLPVKAKKSDRKKNLFVARYRIGKALL